MIFRVAFTPHMVIPDEAKRRSGIHSGTFFGDVPERIAGLLSIARDDRAGEWEALP